MFFMFYVNSGPYRTASYNLLRPPPSKYHLYKLRFALNMSISVRILYAFLLNHLE